MLTSETELVNVSSEHKKSQTTFDIWHDTVIFSVIYWKIYILSE